MNLESNGPWLINWQMAQEIRIALQVTQRFAQCYETSRPRLWFPRVSLAWLGVPPGPFVSDDPNAQSAMINAAGGDNVTPAADSNYAAPEWKQGLREHAFTVDVRRSAIKSARMSMALKGSAHAPANEQNAEDKCPVWDMSHWAARLWSSMRVLKLRMRLWRVLKAIRHSSHLRHAAKNACGVALLSFPGFLSTDSAGYRWFTDAHGQWMVIRSAIIHKPLFSHASCATSAICGSSKRIPARRGGQAIYVL